MHRLVHGVHISRRDGEGERRDAAVLALDSARVGAAERGTSTWSGILCFFASAVKCLYTLGWQIREEGRNLIAVPSPSGYTESGSPGLPRAI